MERKALEDVNHPGVLIESGHFTFRSNEGLTPSFLGSTVRDQKETGTVTLVLPRVYHVDVIPSRGRRTQRLNDVPYLGRVE